MGYNEDKISKKLKIYQSTVNEHSTGLGWNAIEMAVLFFEKLINAKYNNI
jgi:putative heme iron utilization protein